MTAPCKSFGEGSQKRLCLTLLAVSMIVMRAEDASADLKLCNRMSYVLEAAVGLEDKGTTATSGWFRIDPAQCRVVLQGAFSADRVLLNARTLPIYGTPPVPQNGSEELCISAGNFVIAAARQCRGGQTSAPFSEIKPTQTDDGNMVAYLAEDSQYDDEQARLAGIQRLLIVAGYDAAPIDGVDGPKTQAALNSFLKNNGLGADAPQTADFFNVMVAKVQSPSAPGLTWCNDTPHKVAAAIASDDGTTIMSRGWYYIEPGKCLHPDITDQPKRVFSFAEAVDTDGKAIRIKDEPLYWGGPTLLCTRETKFEIDEQSDCVARGLAVNGFATIDSSGGKTLRFGMP